MMQIERLDHLVLTVRDVVTTCDFYARVLGLEIITFGAGRRAILLETTLGHQKINLHQQGQELTPRAIAPTPGSADLCFIVTTPLSQVMTHLQQCGVAIELGPVPRTGANGPIQSIYIRDPDDNLIELSNPLPSPHLNDLRQNTG
ncbi:MAG: VOC family protein [Kaiparowitsia implicata GSE-PSE-MK54-09C]|jgi:catechol 2,3-dioxygenase-like lactoylglutathione lyase family enzyme|nr:VOC family protein [Kaiparowitsia implicata GSE-PSE-MK54-09C]